MERYQQPGAANQKGWDKYVVIGLVLGFTLWIAIIPLDARRFIWSVGFPVWAEVIGGIFLLLNVRNQMFLFKGKFGNRPASPTI